MTLPEKSSSPPFQPPLLGLELTPTLAVEGRGTQRVWQCSQCGLLAIQTDLAPGAIGRCPACEGEGWWRQEIPLRGSRDSLAGLRR